ncbi:cation-transporting P-type ATPase [Tumidithrix elongata RA019]|uniref:Cation-transporting P-type ATPase n=1 Tax=Tumidithrix elongata BACA0141 TaxID=2716417 RepID=A0AAW9Q7G9_9CYAN|nr:cation-transporting P-type ATPase [Tumidithrix elongata RA019]
MTLSNIENLFKQQWHQKSTADTAKILETDLAIGLSKTEVAERQELYGVNEIKGKVGKSAISRFLNEFNQPLIYILLVAGIVTLLLKDWVDASVILGVMVINAVIGFIQASKAENAIAALAKSVTTEATIVRDGQKVQINSRELVLGDLVLLTSGDKVPADLRLVAVRDLQVSESALTGESVPVQKAIEALDADTVLADRRNMVYGSSLVTFGTAKGIVVAIANQTEIGRISQLIEQNTELETPLTRKIEQFSKSLLYVILGLAAFMFVVVMGKGGTWTEGFKSAVALAVSAIPEGLPAVVTVTLAIGVERMTKQHAIIRKLPAVETLGSTTVICSDKTGTLTENQMTVQAIYAGNHSYGVSGVGYESQGAILQEQHPIEIDRLPALRECLKCGLLCNDSHIQTKDGQLTVAGDPTEGALIVSAQKVGLTLQDLEQEQTRLDTIPFESQFQYMATLHQRKEDGQDTDRHIVYIKGSAESILKRCHRQLDANGELIDLERQQIEETIDRMASQGLRVLAFAKKEISDRFQAIDHEDIQTGLVFLGLQGMIDPPRAEAIAAVRTCHSVGIQVKMITGDHALTAAAIARQMGFSQDEKPLVFTGKQLSQMDDRELADAVEKSNVFARIAPEQKLRLVTALQSKGEIVAMTGDGVNDAPALKKADIGIAMGITGTEVAKEAADMILTDDNFASIELAIEEGRTVYGNLLKTIGFILPVNGGEALTILVGILAATSLPILPVQILWVNMVSSVALSATLAFEPKSTDTMRRSPRSPHEPILTPKLLWRILIISAFNLIAVFGVFEWIWQTTSNLDLARTMAVHTLVSAETFYLLSISQCIPSLFAYFQNRYSKNLVKNCNLKIAYIPAIGVACVFIFQVFFSQLPFVNPLFHTQPLSMMQALICISAGVPVILPALFLKRFAPLN